MVSDQEIKALLHPKEHNYFTLAIFAIVPPALLLVLLLVSTLGTILIAFAFAYIAIWFGQALARA